jgi:hypothetical protein
MTIIHGACVLHAGWLSTQTGTKLCKIRILLFHGKIVTRKHLCFTFIKYISCLYMNIIFVM